MQCSFVRHGRHVGNSLLPARATQNTQGTRTCLCKFPCSGMPPVSLPVGMRREIHQVRRGWGGGERPLPLNKEAEKEWGAG